MTMAHDRAECGRLQPLMERLGADLDRFLRFEHDDAQRHAGDWQALLDQPVPHQGAGIDQVLHDIGTVLVPNGAQIAHPGFTSFITTGPASIGVLAGAAGAVASPQRISLTAFNYLEELSLQWLADMFGLPAGMKGVYSSGGSVANLVALGAARQSACERRGFDPARDSLRQPCRLYATQASHRTIQRAAAVLGMGRSAVIEVEADSSGRMRPEALRRRLAADAGKKDIPVAVVANAGTTGTGAIDPLRALGEIAGQYGLWLHVDGAYGLPGILDPEVSHRYDGLELADSVIVDSHKWLGAPVGIGATFVRDRDLLNRAFMQGESDYLEGSFTT
jgi:aromatic-L-amino-acid decarboxylase